MQEEDMDMDMETQFTAVEEDMQQQVDDSGYLVPVDQYLKTGIHIGTKFRTKDMAEFIYKTRADGLSILNLQKIDERIREATRQLSEFAPEDIIVVCRRENGWDLAKKMSQLTGIRVFTGRYPPGILTNIELENFTEAKVMVVVDVWPDRNAVADARRLGIPVFALCDTNNLTHDVDFVIPLNNKGRKSLGMFFYLLAREYMTNRNMIQKAEEFPAKIEDFVSE